MNTRLPDMMTANELLDWVDKFDKAHELVMRQEAIEIAVKYGNIDGAHHKAWVIDQMVRVLAGDKYDQIVAEAKAGEDGPDTYDWDEGIAP